MAIESIVSIISRAPTRIDLAGGTLDIWPLYLFLKNPMTLNLGIDLFAEATMVSSPCPQGKGIVQLRAQDQGAELQFPWSALEDISHVPALELHIKLLRYFAQRKKKTCELSDFNLKLSTQAKSPAGAGLGGSSSLSIALIGAMATWAKIEYPESPESPVGSRVQEARTREINPLIEGESFIEIVRDVETTVIRVPAGLQDYYGAMYGGLQCLRWGTGTHHRESLPEQLLPELEKRILLFYSGQSRNSGINNWTLFKSFIDQNRDVDDKGRQVLDNKDRQVFDNKDRQVPGGNENLVRSKFEQISSATHKLKKYLKNQDWSGVGNAIAEEWEVRKTLASGITTPEIDSAFSEARRIAPVSGKVCGAGGGGCFFVYLPDPDPELKSKIVQIFEERKIQSLPYHGVPRGLEVHVTRS